jgi:O-Antigen ligase
MDQIAISNSYIDTGKVSRGKALIFTFIGLLLTLTNGSQLYFFYGTYFKIFTLLILFSLIIYRRFIKVEPIIIVLTVLCIISNIINDGEINFLNFVNFIISMFLFTSLRTDDLRNILSGYSKVIFALTCVSIPLFLVDRIFPSVMQSMPLWSYSNRNDIYGYGNFYNAFVYTRSLVESDFRNRSIFWEPGVFQFNMVIACYWSLFVEKKKSLLYYFIYLLGFATCLSTSGIYSFFLISISYFLKKFGTEKRNRIAIIVCVILLTCLLFSSYFFFGEYVDKFIINKLETGSFQDRSQSSMDALNIFLNNPFFGVGLVNSGEDAIYITAGIFQILYQLGFFFTIIYVFLCSKYFSAINVFIRIPLVLVLLNSEALIYQHLSVIIMAYGIKHTFYLKKVISPQIKSNAPMTN